MKIELTSASKLLILVALCAIAGCQSPGQQDVFDNPPSAPRSALGACGPSEEPHHAQDGSCASQEQRLAAGDDGMAIDAPSGMAAGLGDVDRNQEASTAEPDPGLARRIGKTRGALTPADVVGYVKSQQGNARRSELLLFREFNFDPTGPAPAFRGPQLARSGAAPAEGGKPQAWIIQFQAPPTKAERDALAAITPILRYVPNNAYLVRLEGKAHGQLQSRKKALGIRAILPYHPGLKFDPLVTARLDGSNLELGEMGLELLTLSGADAATVAAAVRGLGEPDVSVVTTTDQGDFGSVLVHLKTLAPLAAVTDLAASMEEVDAINEFRRPEIVNDESVWVIQSGDPGSRATPLFDKGVFGRGEVVTVMDTGLDIDHCAFRYDGSASSKTFVSPAQAPAVDVSNPTNKVIAYYLNGGSAYDECDHGTHVAGSVLGDTFPNVCSGTNAGHDKGDGMAPGAQLVVQDIGNCGMWGCCGLSIGNLTSAFDQSYASGSRVHTNSWGSTGTGYSSFAYAVDQAMWKNNDYLILFAAGNAGPAPATINTHSTAKAGLSIAASTHGSSRSEALTSFSSHGPAADGRIKPDVAAPGEAIVSAKNDNNINSDNCGLVGMSGTSMATPTAAGGAAQVRQYFADGYYPSGAPNPAQGFNPSGALTKAILINSARNLPGAYTATDGRGGGAAPVPTSGQGWGRITLGDALYFTGEDRQLRVLNDVWNGATTVVAPAVTTAMTTGGLHEFQLPGVSCFEPLKLTLAWSDPPGAGSSGVQLVNDLDLEVVAPDGTTTYHGNHFSGGWSVAGGAADRLNPLENVSIRFPQNGTYTVRVHGKNVPGKGLTSPFDDTLQGYALVATGNFSNSTAPYLAEESTRVYGGCDNDKYLDKGETVQVDVSVRNRGCTASSTGTQLTLTVAPESEIPASALILPAPMSFGEIGPDSVETRTLPVGLKSSTTDWSGKSAVLIATVTDATHGVTNQFRIRIESSLDVVDAFVDPVKDDVNVGWTNRPNDQHYTMDQRPWLLQPAVYGAPSPQVWSDSSGAGADFFAGINTGWMSPFIPIGANEALDSLELWRYVDFGTATKGDAYLFVAYFDTAVNPTGTLYVDGHLGSQTALYYSVGSPGQRIWAEEKATLNRQPAGTTHFRLIWTIRGLNGKGEGIFFDQIRARKRVVDTKAPCSESCTQMPAFSGLKAANATCSMIELVWDPATSKCGGAIQYNVYRGTRPDMSDATRLSACGLSDTRYVDAAVTVGSTYYYEVRAEDYATGSGPCGGNERTQASPIVLAATPSAGAPVFAGATGTGDGKCNAVTLSWTTAAPLCPGGDVSYNIYRSTAPGTLGTRVSSCGQQTGTTFTDIGLTPGSTYHYTVRARDSKSTDCAVGSESTNTAQIAATPTDTTPPVVSSPPAVSYTSCSGNVAITWAAATDSCTDIKDYIVYRSTTAGALGTPVGTTTGRSLEDVTDPTITYYYTVRARDTATVGSVSASNESTNTAQTATKMMPTFTGVKTVQSGGMSCGSVELYWADATPGCPTAGLHYNVYRSLEPNFTPSATNRITDCTTPLTSTSFFDTNVEGGKRYYYVVRAEDSAKTGGGACGGYEDTNTVRGSTYAESALFSEGFESGLDPQVWEFTENFTSATSQAHEGERSVWSGNAPGGCDVLALKNFLELPLEDVSLLFWSNFEIDPNRDRGIVEVSTDDVNWAVVTPEGGYPGLNIDGSTCIPKSYQASFTGSSGGAWKPYKVNLSGYAGKSIKLRFRYGTHTASTAAGGWFIDDIRITSAGACFSCTKPPQFAGLTSVTSGSTCGALRLSWPAATPGCADKAVHYNVYRSEVKGELGTIITSCANPVLGTTFTDTSRMPGKTYFYTVRAEDGSSGQGGPCGGNTDLNNNQIGGRYVDSTAPTFSGIVSATNDCQTGNIQLGWASASDSCAGVKDYQVFRSESPTTRGDWIATVPVAYAADDSGNERGLELRGEPMPVVGQDGQGLEFRGNAVALAHPGGIPLGNTWEIEAWFRYPFNNGNTTGWHTLTRGNGCGDNQIVIHTDQISLGGTDNCGGTGWRDSGFDVNVLAPGWHKVKAVGTASGDTQYYVDDVLVGTIVGWKSTSNVYSIGNRDTGGQAFGALDGVRISVEGELKASYSFEGALPPSTRYVDTPPATGVTYYYSVWARDGNGATNYNVAQASITSDTGLSFAGLTSADGQGTCNRASLSWTAPSSSCVGGPVGQDVPGLLGEYYDNDNFTGYWGARSDATLDFDWGSAAPVSGMGVDTFSVKWTGSLEVPESGTYALHLTSDDGARMWVNGIQVVNDWVCAAPKERVTSLPLAAGRHPVVIEYKDCSGIAQLRLEWACADCATPLAREVVPANRLFHPYSGEEALRYNVYRADAEAGPFALLQACLMKSPFSDGGLVKEQTYFYKVRIEDTSIAGSGPCGGLEYDNASVRDATPTDTSSPSFTSSSSVARANCTTGAVDLHWPLASDCSADQISYRIYRSEVQGFTGVQIHQTPAALSLVARDASANGNHGTIIGPWPTSGRDGGANTALQLAGPKELRVEVPSSDSLNPTSGLTLEAWVNPRSFQSYGTYLHKNLQYILRNFSTTGRVQFLVYSSGAWYSCTSPVGQETPLNTWTHVAGTFDGATGRLYLDGNQVCTFARAGTIDTSPNPLFIGLAPTAYSWYDYEFNGSLDEVRVYPYARTAQEIGSDAATTGVNDLAMVAASYSFTSEGGAPLEFSDTTVVDGQQYYYSIKADDGEGYLTGGGFGGLVLACKPEAQCMTPPTFAGVTSVATGSPLCGAYPPVTVSWAPASATCAGYPIHYNVYRSEVPGVPGTLISSCASRLTGTSFIDVNARPGVVHYYTVRAEDSFSGLTGACGGHEEGNLTQVSITTSAEQEQNVAPASTTFAGLATASGGGCGERPTLSWKAPLEEQRDIGVEDCDGQGFARYSFDDGTATDLSGHDHHGTLSEGVTAVTPGRDGAGQALGFAGSAGSTVNIANAPALSPGTNFSVEAWVNPSQYVSNATFVRKDLQYILRNSGTTGRVQFQVYVNGGWRSCLTAVDDGDPTNGLEVTPIGTWSHVMGTYDGATLRVLINGVQKCSTAYAGTVVATANALHLGSFNGTSDYFRGQLDDVRIGDFMNAVQLLDGIEERAGTLLAYDFDDGKATDLSSLRNDGTLHGVTAVPGIRGQALDFTGKSGSYVVASADPRQHTPEELVVEAWANPDGFADSYSVYVMKDGEFYLRDYSTYGRPQFYVYVNGGYRGCSSGTAIPVGTWSHLMGTYDGSTVRLFVDGVQRCSTSYVGSIPNTSNRVFVGSWNGGSDFFDGRIDEVRIHDVPRPASHAADFRFDAQGDDRALFTPGLVLRNGAKLATGYSRQGLSLDGVDDHASSPDAPERKPGTGSLTVETWLQTTAGTGVMVAKGANGTGAGYRVELAAGRVRATLADGATAVSAVGATAVNDGRWHHVAAVFDRGATGGIQLYIDGVPDVASAPSISALGSADSPEALTLGATSGATPATFLAGMLDDVTVTHRARRAQEIRGSADAVSRVGEWRVYRSTTAGTLGTRVETLSRRQLNYVDSEPLAEGTYFYTVRYADSAGVEDSNLVQRSVTVTGSRAAFTGITRAMGGTCGESTLYLEPASVCSTRLGTEEPQLRVIAGEIITYADDLASQAAPANLAEYSGRLAVPAAGTYTFQCDKSSSSRCYAWINGSPLGFNGTTGSKVSATYTFPEAGSHDFRFQFSISGTENVFTLQWRCAAADCQAGAPTTLAPIPASAFSHPVENVDLVRYNVYRSTSEGELGTLVKACATSAGNSLQDKPPGPGTYHYTIRAENIGAVGTGECGGIEDQNDVQASTIPSDTGWTSFTGLTSIANDCSSGAITLHWNAFKDSCSATKEYRVFRSDQAGARGQLIATLGPDATSYTDTETVPGTTYYYEVFAFDLWGNWDTSTTVMSVTASDTPLAPIPYYGNGSIWSVTSGNRCNDSVINWRAATAQCTGASLSYNLYRATSPSGPFELYASGLSGTSYTTPKALTTGTTYYWRVRAQESLGGVEEEGTRTIVATVTDTTRPTFGGLSSVSTDCDSGTNLLSWSAGSDACSSVSYDVYRSDIPGEPGSVIASLPQATTSFTDTTAAAGQTYSYTVIARDTSGNEASTIIQRDVTTASESPVFDGVRTVVLGERCDVAQLSWVAGRSMCQGRSLHYNVYRSATDGALGSLISEPTNKVLLTSGNFTRSNAVLRNGDVVTFDVMPTTTSPNFRAYLLTPDDLYGVGIYFNGNKVWSRRFEGSTSGKDSPNLLSEIKAGRWYRVRLSIDDRKGLLAEVFEREGFASGSYQWDTMPAAVKGRLDWGFKAYGDSTKAANYVDNYSEFSGAAGAFEDSFDTANTTAWNFGPGQTVPHLVQLTGTSFTDFHADFGTTWHYTVRAEDDSTGGTGPAGGVEDSNTHQVAFTPSDYEPPSFGGISAAVSTCESDGSIALDFGAAQDKCSGIDSYVVYRSTSPGALGTQIGTSTASGFLDTETTVGTRYYYTVRARDGAGNEDNNLAQLVAMAGESTPGFDGVERVIARGCAENELSWTPAVSRCLSRNIRYNIYRSMEPDFTPSEENLITSCASPVPTMSPGGLLGHYFGDKNLASLKAVRTDPVVNFSWGTGAPMSEIGKDGFSVRWSGQLQVDTEGPYTLFVNADDGVRLSVDGARLIDSWKDGALERSAVITLISGTHDIVLEYYESTNTATAQLSWACDACGIPKQIIPAANLLYPTARFVDASPIPGRPNYYVVRADDSPLAKVGACVGNEDTNAVSRGVDVLAGDVGPGPIAAYSFDDGTANDTSGRLNQGTLYGDVTPAHTEGQNGALSFGGVNGHVEVSMRLPDTNESIGFWFKTTAAGVGLYEYMDGSGGTTPGANYDRSVYLDGSGRVCQRVYNNETICSTAAYNDGAWHQYAFTLEKDVGQKMFIDGVEVARGTKSISDFRSGTRFWIGYAHHPGSGYFSGLLDEVEVHDYVAFQESGFCPVPPAAPVVALSEPCGTTANTVKLAWNAVAGATSYEISRCESNCGLQGNYRPFATTSETSYADTSVSGGAGAPTYSYKVRAYASTTRMFGDSSPAVSCQPSGTCTVAPTFAGLGSLRSSHLTYCANDLSWEAAGNNCADQASGPMRYNIYRSTVPSFTPSEFNRITSCFVGEVYRDQDVSLVSGQRYYYIVRAEDPMTTGSGPCGGNEDGNTSVVGLVAEGEWRVAVWSDTAGDGAPLKLELPVQNWRTTIWQNHTEGGSHSYYTGSGFAQCDAATTPVLQLNGSQSTLNPSPTLLSFWANYRTSVGDSGLVVEVATEPGFDNWRVLGTSANYPATLDGRDNGCGLPSGTPVVASTTSGGSLSGWTQFVFDLSAYEHQQVQLRFRKTNSLSSPVIGGGVYLDDIEITNADVAIGCAGAIAPPPCTGAPLFAGVGSVTNTGGTNSLDVTWQPASESCVGSNIRYNIYRSTGAPFVPSRDNLLVSCQAGTSYTDTGIVQGTVYAYVVRAEDVNHPGSGPCGGMEDGNADYLSASATGTRTVSVYDDFSGELSERWVSTGGWQKSSAVAVSGESVHLPSEVGQCAALEMASWRTLPVGVSTYFTLHARYSTEAHFDGGYVELTTDGVEWTLVKPEGGYPSRLARTSSACTVPGASALQGFSGSTNGAFRKSIFNISAWQGMSVKLRIRWGSDGAVQPSDAGLWLDNVAFESK